MKKNIIIIVIITVIMSMSLCSCSTPEINNTTIMSQTSGISQITSPEITNTTFQPDLKNEIGKAKVDWVYFKTLDDLIKDCDQIFIGSITEISAPISVEYAEIGLKIENEYALLLPCEIQVFEIIKGNLTVNSKITINQVVMYYSEDQLLKKNETHLFFIKGSPDERINSLRQFILEPPTVGYPKIINGKLSVYEGNNLFNDGQSIDVVKGMVQNEIQN